MQAGQYILKFLGDFATILGEMAPYLLLGFFFAGLLYAFIPRKKIDKYFNGSPFRSSIFSSLFGIPLPLCSCGVIPTGAALYKNGASKGGTVSFYDFYTANRCRFHIGNIFAHGIAICHYPSDFRFNYRNFRRFNYKCNYKKRACTSVR